MLRNRSRAVTTTSSKQAPPMADHTSSLSSSPPNQNQIASISSLLGSPRLIFNDFLARNHSDPENGMSPNSILESKHFSNFKNPFGYDRNVRKTSFVYSENKHPYEKLDSEGIGLAMLEENFSKPSSKMVLFGAKLKVQIPPLTPSAESPSELPKSPADFGIKTRSQHVSGRFGPNTARNHAHGRLSLSEMELSEDYTCVVTHGPNPKKIHIFDNCIVDSCCGVVELSELKKEHGLSSTHNTSPRHQTLNFLRFCHTCKDKLQAGKDIYMYRGEKAFCSHECRCQGMLSEGEKDSELDY